MIRVIIAGGRDFKGNESFMLKLDAQLKHLPEEVQIVSGCAKGADTFGEEYAESRGLSVAKFPADWKNLGRKAGPLRNIQMAEYADAVIAFWDGQSRGTFHMMTEARKRNMPVRVIHYGSFL